jgi:predicted nucleotidyltransferase
LNPRIEIPIDRISEFCHRNHIRRLALFGSVLRDDFAPESDVDVLVEFEPGTRVGFAFITMQDELSNVLGRRVDMNTFEGVERSRNWLLRSEILDSTQVVYEQAR